MSKIGIFWVYRGTVIGRARPLNDGQENVPGLIDSPDSHVDLWENDPDFVIPFPELRGTEYQKVPRGRVIYATAVNKPVVYMDRTLHTPELKAVVCEFFELCADEVIWKTDSHYRMTSN